MSAVALTAAVGQENLLLQTYNVTLPPAHNRDASLVPGSRDPNATAILFALQPSLLDNHLPLSVIDDGNCMFRAVSRAMYGTEDLHALLRLLTALEMACFPATYDPAHSDYENLVNDTRIHVPSYRESLYIATKLGAATEMIHLYALSAVIDKPIQSVYPVRNEHWISWDRLVVDRNVQQRTTDIKVLWSAATTPTDMQAFSANHFVLVHQVTDAMSIQPIPSLTLRSPNDSNTENAKRRRQKSCRGKLKKSRNAAVSAANDAQQEDDNNQSPATVQEETESTLGAQLVTNLCHILTCIAVAVRLKPLSQSYSDYYCW